MPAEGQSWMGNLGYLLQENTYIYIHIMYISTIYAHLHLQIYIRIYTHKRMIENRNTHSHTVGKNCGAYTKTQSNL